jgi:ADP-ribose pyrophosphatase YjhB (NUDIX family)
VMSGAPIFDVFQKGLIRGSERLPFDPVKAYAYVEHPTEGWRVYLRSCAFLHEMNQPFQSRKFLVFKKSRAHTMSYKWEPPKGQMEGKDIRERRSVLELLKENVRRETEEEAHIIEIKSLTHTGLVFQSQEHDYPPDHYFQYHLFQGFVTADQIKESFNTFEWMKEHPKAVARWKRDRKETDKAAWFDPKATRLNPRWCPDIVVLYLQHIKKPM